MMHQRHIIFILFIILLFPSVIIISPIHLATADTITIVADKWPPYNGDPESPTPGYGIEIAQRIYEAEGHSVKYIIRPWIRAIRETRMGMHSAIIGAYKENAPDFIFPDESFGLSRNAFFVKRDNAWRFRNIESLASVKIGLIKDYNYGKDVDAFFKTHPKRLHYAFGEKALWELIKCLDENIINTTIEDENVFIQKSSEMGITDKFINAGYSTSDGIEVYIAFSPKSPRSKEYARLFSEGIRKLKDSGELDKILKKYKISYWR